MSRERAKGSAFERRVRDFLRERLATDANRLPAGAAKDVGDVHVDGLPVTFECKDHARMELSAWLDEAVRESDNAGTAFGVVVHHRRGRGAKRFDETYVTMRLGDFAQLMRDWMEQ